MLGKDLLNFCIYKSFKDFALKNEKSQEAHTYSM